MKVGDVVSLKSQPDVLLTVEEVLLTVPTPSISVVWLDSQHVMHRDGFSADLLIERDIPAPSITFGFATK